MLTAPVSLPQAAVTYYPQYPADVSGRLLTLLLLLLTSFAIALNEKVVVLLYPGKSDPHWFWWVFVFWLLMIAYCALIFTSVGLLFLDTICNLPSFAARDSMALGDEVRHCWTKALVAYCVLLALITTQTICAFVILRKRGY